MGKTYGFRLGENDGDLEKILEPMTGKDRSFYIKEAIRFYYKCGEKINNIAVTTEKILSIIGNRDIAANVTDEELSEEGPEDKSKNDIDAEKIIADSIRDILNLGN